MSLLAMATMLNHAKENHYAIPAFNVWDLQSMYALKLAAEEQDAPVIIAGADMGDGAIGNPNPEFWASLARTCANESSMPMAIHLDHGRSFDSVMKAMRLGFSSVMIDASTLPFDENVAVTRKVVEAAHAVGVTVEAELGHVGEGSEELTEDLQEKLFTKPEEAIQFVEETGVDALAVAVGTQHGVYHFEPKLNWDLLKELIDCVPACLVLHGGSGTPGLEDAAHIGVTKINIGTEIVLSLIERLQQEVVKSGFAALQGVLSGCVEAQKNVMVDRIRCFGANGQGHALMTAVANDLKSELVTPERLE
jgi:fructose-bisphosphate aldolase class II